VIDPADTALAIDHFHEKHLLRRGPLDHVLNHQLAEGDGLSIVGQRQAAQLLNSAGTATQDKSIDTHRSSKSDPDLQKPDSAWFVCSKLITAGAEGASSSSWHRLIVIVRSTPSSERTYCDAIWRS
jgi:hypothetical protein